MKHGGRDGRSGRQNVTLSLPSELLREARRLAVDRGVSLSRFLTLFLEEQMVTGRRYQAARERQLRLLKKGLPLGTEGRIDWARSTR